MVKKLIPSLPPAWGFCHSALAALLLSLEAMAAGPGPGTLIFNNSAGTLGSAAIVVGPDRVPLSGTGWIAQLYVGTSPNSLAPALNASGVAEALTFKTTGTLGVFNTSGRDTVRFAPVLAGDMVYAQIQVWEAAAGPNAGFWDAFMRGFWAGHSALLYIPTGGAGIPAGLPLPLTGLESFGIVVPIPEPSTFALGLLGAVVLAAYPRQSGGTRRT